MGEARPIPIGGSISVRIVGIREATVYTHFYYRGYAGQRAYTLPFDVGSRGFPTVLQCRSPRRWRKVKVPFSAVSTAQFIQAGWSLPI